MFDYLRVMKSNVDAQELARASVDMKSLISQVIIGLDEEYNPMVATFEGRFGLTWLQMQVELWDFEKRLESQQALKSSQSFTPTISMNMEHRKPVSHFLYQSFNQSNRFFTPQNYVQNYSLRGKNRDRGCDRWQGNNRHFCQVCEKLGHSGLSCCMLSLF